MHIHQPVLVAIFAVYSSTSLFLGSSAFEITRNCRREWFNVQSQKIHGSPSLAVQLSGQQQQDPLEIDGKSSSMGKEYNFAVENSGDLANDKELPKLVSPSSTSPQKEASPQKEEEYSRKRNVRFISPCLEYGYPPAVEDFENKSMLDKPLLLYLPGFDGTFLSPFIQFPELSTIFDVRCMNIGSDDRSTLDELRQSVLDYLYQEFNTGETSVPDSSGKQSDEALQASGKRNILANMFGNNGGSRKEEKSESVGSSDVYLVGESFGGILASDVALTILNNTTWPFRLKGMTLINAATCYDRSKLAAEAPLVADLNPLLYPIGLLKLLPLFADEYSAKQLLLILQAKALPSVIDNAQREAYMGRVAFSLPTVLPTMPQETLQWRLSQWLEIGCVRMSTRLADFAKFPSFRTLIIAGEKDGTLPSIAEAERLASILPENFVHVVEGAGHASTCGSRIDLAAVFRMRFKELRRSKGRTIGGNGGGGGSGLWPKRNSAGNFTTTVSDISRTRMKEVAAAGEGEFFGMEPRYDGANVGLNPLLYWGRNYYRRVVDNLQEFRRRQ